MGLGRETQRAGVLARHQLAINQGQFEPWDENSCPWISNGRWLNTQPDPRWTHFAHPVSGFTLSHITMGTRLSHWRDTDTHVDSHIHDTQSSLPRQPCSPPAAPTTDGATQNLHAKRLLYSHLPPLSPPPTICTQRRFTNTERTPSSDQVGSRPFSQLSLVPRQPGIPPSLLSAWPGTRAAG